MIPVYLFSSLVWAFATMTLNRFLLHIRAVESRDGLPLADDANYDHYVRTGSRHTGQNGREQTELAVRSVTVNVDTVTDIR